MPRPRSDRPTYTSSTRPHWMDAARMLEQAARQIRKAAALDQALAGVPRPTASRPATTSIARLLSEARANIDAAVTRLKDAPKP